MLFKTTDEHEALRKKVREFAEEKVKPIAFELDQNNEFPEIRWSRFRRNELCDHS